MTNLSGKTREQLVLDLLRSQEWVSTMEVQNVAVGGAAGTSRIRDLRRKGYVIESKPHPDPKISQYLYHLAGRNELGDELPPEAGGGKRRIFIEEPTPDGRSSSLRHSGDTSPARRDALSGSPQPFVAWHGDTSRGFTVRHRGFGMSVRPFWGNKTWIWVVTKPDGKQESGTAADLAAAKRAAYEATGL